MKKNYTKPTLDLHLVALENDITVGSAYINVGQNPDYRPDVEEWNDSAPDTEVYGANL